jgi:hypothetical protein
MPLLLVLSLDGSSRAMSTSLPLQCGSRRRPGGPPARAARLMKLQLPRCSLLVTKKRNLGRLVRVRGYSGVPTVTPNLKARGTLASLNLKPVPVALRAAQATSVAP